GVPLRDRGDPPGALGDPGARLPSRRPGPGALAPPGGAGMADRPARRGEGGEGEVPQAHPGAGALPPPRPPALPPVFPHHHPRVRAGHVPRGGAEGRVPEGLHDPPGTDRGPPVARDRVRHDPVGAPVGSAPRAALARRASVVVGGGGPGPGDPASASLRRGARARARRLGPLELDGAVLGPAHGLPERDGGGGGPRAHQLDRQPGRGLRALGDGQDEGRDRELLGGTVLPRRSLHPGRNPGDRPPDPRGRRPYDFLRTAESPSAKARAGKRGSLSARASSARSSGPRRLGQAFGAPEAGAARSVSTSNSPAARARTSPDPAPQPVSRPRPSASSVTDSSVIPPWTRSRACSASRPSAASRIAPRRRRGSLRGAAERRTPSTASKTT